MEYIKEIKKGANISKITLAFDYGVKEYRDDTADINKLKDELEYDLNRQIENTTSSEYILKKIKKIHNLNDVFFYYRETKKYYNSPTIRNAEYSKEISICR